ncbi:cytochrome P450 [Mycobacterium heckeshornense]|uniref:Putative cytochrome P450 143 n=1 Tax=Mycobacterium heckeshornense TaxID=110505 RepID=A0A2G8B4N9_9MYCO|nr:cytochrome P450 [Mycobacterium heckeshornense]KMV24229.1 cytochrome P450 [Mycobacterium heckeshornense]MCV7036463.1 cytochrome P450 [Mycobacterium heckeshornense]PIJ32712.1 cytochrome P450 [Mycobacterium heckeshornense]BCO34325.1 putative cytochrome P450 143 [Mycobacterium heckeshornense]
MSAEAIPKIHTDDLPMPEARDEAWLIMGRCPVVELEDGYAVTTRDLIEAVLRDPSTFSSKKAFDVLASPVPLVPIAFDPPQQTRYRQILQPFFSPRAIKPLEPELRKQIIEIIEPIAARGRCEFVAEVAGVFPIQVFLTLFGLPLDMRDQFIEWKNAVLSLASASGSVTTDEEAASKGLQKAGELFMYLSELIQTRRGQPGDDVLSRVLNLQPPHALTDEEAIGLCFLFVLAGLDTVMDALGFGMQRLAENPDKRREIIDDPTLIPAATEELLRLDPPAPFVPRVTTKETTIGDVTCPAGTRVTNYLAVANRDESEFPNPYAIDFHRADNRHISFGMGAHRCLGSHLARLEMNIVYEEWHKRIPRYHITPGTTPRVHWPRGTVGLESLHLTLEGSVAQ